MKVVVTGGCGFLGMRLARKLLERGELTGPDGVATPIDEIALADVQVPAGRPSWADQRVSFWSGDVSDPAWTESLVDRDDISVFHLASIVSSHAETDLDLALHVNIDGARSILNAARRRAGATRFVTTSTFATFGGDLPGVCTDGTKQTPQSTYGVTKVLLELLVNDYTRRGLIDGRTARLATVIIRPGAANLAASSVASAIFREPLAGRDYEVPVAPETRMAVAGIRAVVEGLVALHEADPALLGADRAMSFPSTDHTIQEMADTLRRVAADRPLGAITWNPDPRIVALVSTWPAVVDASNALAIGVPPADPLERIVRDYAAEVAPAARVELNDTDTDPNASLSIVTTSPRSTQCVCTRLPSITIEPAGSPVARAGPLASQTSASSGSPRMSAPTPEPISRPFTAIIADTRPRSRSRHATSSRPSTQPAPKKSSAVSVGASSERQST